MLYVILLLNNVNTYESVQQFRITSSSRNKYQGRGGQYQYISRTDHTHAFRPRPVSLSTLRARPLSLPPSVPWVNRREGEKKEKKTKKN